MTEIKNRNDKEMKRSFTELTGDFQSRGINPGFHFMDNKSLTYFKMSMTTLNITYQLVPPSNHRENNVERARQTFRNHFIAGLFSVDKGFHIGLWNILIQK